MKEESLVLTLFAGISSVAVSMILPYIPLFAQESGLSLELIGYVVFTYYIVQVIMRIPIGSLSDALGDDRIILMGAVSMLLSPLFYLLSLRVPVLIFIAQALLGIGHSVTWVTSPSLITKFRGPLHLYTFFMGLGWFIGPPIGGKLRDLFGMTPLFVALFLLSLSSLLFALLLKKRMRTERRIRRIDEIITLSFRSIRDAVKLLKKKEILIASYISFIMFMSFGLGASLLPLYLSEIGFSSFLIGLATSMRMGVSTIIRLFTRPLIESSAKVPILLLCSCSTGISVVLISMTKSFIPILILSALWGLGVGIYLPVVFSIVADSTREDERGIAMGLRGSMGSLGSAVGTITFMHLANSFSISYALLISGVAILVLSIPPILRGLAER